jgi:subtilase family serine protease
MVVQLDIARIILHNSAWGTGPKYIIAVADGDNIFYETNESNNTSVSLINIYDKPLISIATTDSSATETNIGETINPGRFTLNRTGGNIATPLSVNYNMTGSATNGIDYSNLTGAVTFAAGSNQAIIDINPINESSIENTETVIVTLLSNSAYTLGSVATASLSITDNDVDITGQISLSQTSATIGDSITVGSYSVNNGFTTVSPTYVRYWLSNYTNLESSPNTNILLGQNPLLPLGPGVSRYDSVNFVYNESWGYGAKYIIVQVDAYNNVAEVNESNNISFRFIDISNKPTISIASTDATASESNVGEVANPGRFTLTRTGSVTSALTVNYAVSGSANSADYSALTGNVTFIAGASQAVIDISPINDALVEETETVTVSLVSNIAYQLGTIATASVSIVDNDLDLIIQNQTAPTTAFVGDAINISSYTRNNASATTGSNFVRYWLSNDTVFDSSDLSLGYNSVGILGGGTSEYDTFSFSYNGAQGTGTKYILFQADGYGYIAEANESNNISYAAITLSNKPTISISATDSTSGETIAGATANPGRFTLTRTESTNSALTVSYTVSGTATNGTDYGALSGTVSFVAGSSQAVIDINPIDDTSTEQTENVIVTLSLSSLYNLSNIISASLSIADNEGSDLIIYGQTAPVYAVSGSTISISSITKNIGGSFTSMNSFVKYYMSSDTTLDAQDIFLGYGDNGYLSSGESKQNSFVFTYDEGWNIGSRYIIFEADGYKWVTESDETNNIAYSPITITSAPPKPDIDIQIYDPYGAFSNTWRWQAMQVAVSNWEKIIARDKDRSGIFKITVTNDATKPDNNGNPVAWGNVAAWAYLDPTVGKRANFTGDVDMGGVDYHNRLSWNSNMMNDHSVNQIIGIMMHEIGHALGLEHETNNSNSLMYPMSNSINVISETMLTELERQGYVVDRSILGQLVWNI